MLAFSFDMNKLPLKKCPHCPGKLIPKVSTVRRAHSGSGEDARQCWMYDLVCNNCGLRVVEEMHGFGERGELIRMLRGR